MASFPAVMVPTTAMTLGGFRAWTRSDSFPQQGHIAYLNGKLFIDMSPERYETHLKIKSLLTYVLMGIVEQEDMGDFYSDGGFITNDSADLSNEPDAMFASWDTLLSAKLAPPQDRPKDGKHIELVGTPDWVSEIVSDSSVVKDTDLLRKAYHKAGVSEYWLIDARMEVIYFQILKWTPQGYIESENQQDWHTSPIFGRHFRLTRTRDRLDRWKYSLEHRV